MIQAFHWISSFVLHLDVHLNQMAVEFGPWLYVILFLIIFCETGLVVMPFLPGDSLLFAVGALTAIDGSVLDFWVILFLLIGAGVLGDAVNYSIGKFVGPRVFKSTESVWLNREHLLRTRKFYEKYGGRTIVMARFLPIIRTLAPFVAGVGSMRYRDFAIYNVAGSILWVGSFLALGRWFGNLTVVKQNFSLVVLGIIGVSCLPLVLEFIRNRKGTGSEQSSV